MNKLTPTVIFPFPTTSIAQLAVEFEQQIAATERHLWLVFKNASGPRCEWSTENIPWFRALTTPSLTAANVFPNIDMGDTRLDPAKCEFVECIIRCENEEITQDEFLRSTAQFGKMVRKANVYSYSKIGVKDLQFFPPDFILNELYKLCNLRTKFNDVPALLVAIIQFAYFIAIHPFMDGNGRASRRLLLNLLKKYHYWKEDEIPLPFLLYRDRTRYVMATRQLFLKGDWNLFVEYMLKVLRAAAELSVLTRYLHPEEYPSL